MRLKLKNGATINLQKKHVVGITTFIGFDQFLSSDIAEVEVLLSNGLAIDAREPKFRILEVISELVD